MALLCEVSGKSDVAAVAAEVATDDAIAVELSPTAAEWDLHWRGQRNSIFGRVCSLYRRQIRARSVAYHFEQFFPRQGLFAECGSGSSETSSRIKVYQRTLIAVDFSQEALARAARRSQISQCLQADIRQLPFDDESLDGIWNLGVMEHFPDAEQHAVLNEFHRVLRKGGRLMMWWPPKLAIDHLLLSPFGWHFPAEPGRLNPSAMRDRCRSSGFAEVDVSFPLSDCGTECLVRAVRADTAL